MYLKITYWTDGINTVHCTLLHEEHIDSGQTNILYMCKVGPAAAGRQADHEFRPFRPANFGRIDRPARPRPLKFPGRQVDRPRSQNISPASCFETMKSCNVLCTRDMWVLLHVVYMWGKLTQLIRWMFSHNINAKQENFHDTCENSHRPGPASAWTLRPIGLMRF